MSEIDPFKYGQLVAQVEQMEKKIDKLEQGMDAGAQTPPRERSPGWAERTSGDGARAAPRGAPSHGEDDGPSRRYADSSGGGASCGGPLASFESKNCFKSPKVRSGSLPVFMAFVSGFGGPLGPLATYVRGPCSRGGRDRCWPRPPAGRGGRGGRSPPCPPPAGAGRCSRAAASLGSCPPRALRDSWRSLACRCRSRSAGAIIVSATRRRALSSSSTQTGTICPTLTTSCGSRTKRLDSWLMCTRPLSCRPMSTKAPKSTTLSTDPSSSIPTSRSSSFRTPFLKNGFGRSSRGSRPGRLSCSTMSASSSRPTPSSSARATRSKAAARSAIASVCWRLARSAGPPPIRSNTRSATA